MDTEIDSSKITDLVLGKLHPSEARELIDAIAQDPKLSETLELAVKIYAFSQEEANDLFARRVEPEENSLRIAWSKLGEIFVGRGRRRFALSLLAMISILVILALAKDSLTSRDTLQYPKSSWISWSSQRIPTSTDLIYAEARMKEGEYKDALSTLERHLRAYPEDPLLRQIQYNSAVLVLFLSRNTILGIRYSNDPSQVQVGIDLLGGISSGQAPAALKDRARLLRAKALVCIGRENEAFEDLRDLSASEGDCQADAIELLNTLARK